jgi:hypothetical protein
MMGDAMHIELKKKKTIEGYQEDVRAQPEHQTTK